MLLIGTTLIGVACAGTAGVCYLLRAGTPRRDDDDHGGGGGPHGPQGPTDWDGFERDLWAHTRRDRPTVGV
jgi:hypothetical protein